MTTRAPAVLKIVNGDGQRVAKASKIHRCQWFSPKKNVPSHRFQKMTIAHLYMSWINASKEKSFCLLYIEGLAKSIFITCGLKLDEDNDKKDELHFHLCILN